MNHREALQRILLPKRGEPFDVCMLYLIESTQNKERLSWNTRTDVTVPAGAEASFETYFNAFPASYWRRWSQLDSVVLTMKVTGTANIAVYRSKVDGTRVGVSNHLIADDTLDIELPLKNFEDGGWYWFDVTAETDTIISEAAWCAPHAPKPQTLPDGSTIEPAAKKVAVGIPTFNRPADAVAALQALGEDPVVEQAISHVLMPDQGNQHPADEPGYDDAVAVFGERFREFRQGNLGGSGGYSRIMYEFVENTDAPFVLFMDDDIAIEPDSILRAVQAARFAASPIVVGGQMLNLQQRAQLRTTGEMIQGHDFMWGPAPYGVYDHDFSEYPLGYTLTEEQQRNPHAKSSADLHRRVDVSYNGWWMCLFPRVVAETVGQPLPLFIKWDDTEYSLRAAEFGFPTVTWPGAAIWHMAWADKDDAIDWQAYFHLRNRLITAAMYHRGSFKGVARSIMKSSYKHALCMEYSTMAIQIEAMRDFLSGPAQLFDVLESSLPRIQKIRQNYDDAVIYESAADLPAPTGANVPLRNVGGRLGKVKKIPWLLKTLRHMSREADPAHYEAPQINLNPKDARWYNLSRVDSATVTTAGGTGVAFRKRDKQLTSELLSQTRQLLKDIDARFDELQETYRSARPQLTARESWKKVFDAQ
ncbi:glycosyltransferase [Corynebacterium pseudodiphtheriticum]|uniref:Glycosyltransferase n=1 Tax=Corynebacterium pseudodiphtheriticum TaxID=37637 RepID=A0AAP4BNW6_9CORY|nr:glycosyltransferase [Corynebacterium pseudodiphtheriticum]MCG7251175.1 glycosyltransferase [Corynebacterium pseudodiphtheriticum]MDC7067876.1 glycosyltransferase [Corynebacterium pseudodiphtheriticum]MDC7084056.1 glycosyltransferase [Corynebacterium pseudodiphtheriticum]MDC7086393.1 glycosyltransferase [Corynebacterium pseudodiphtheriticum]MDK4227491.1 glycosyltransferase [Corynebacterium pseudodiphtheriticum]